MKRAGLGSKAGLVGSVLLVGVIGAALWTVASQAQETVGTAPAAAAIAAVPAAWYIAPVGAVLGLIFAFVFYKSMISADEGDDKMKEIAGHVRVGAMAYLTRQYKVVAIVFAVMALFFAVLAFGLHTLPKIVPLAFLTGGFFSALAGWLGMATATRASNRTAAGAKKSLDRGLKVAIRSGAVFHHSQTCVSSSSLMTRS